MIQHPLVYQFGPVEVTGFGIAMLLAFIIAQIVMTKDARLGADSRSPRRR